MLISSLQHHSHENLYLSTMSSSESVYSTDSLAISSATTLDEASLPCYPQPAHLRTTRPRPTRRFDLERYGDQSINVQSTTSSTTTSGATTPHILTPGPSEEMVSWIDYLKSAATDSETSSGLSSSHNTNRTGGELPSSKKTHDKKPSRACCDLDFSFRGLYSSNTNVASGTTCSRRAVIGSGEGLGPLCMVM